MFYTIMFDETSFAWQKSHEVNQMFVLTQIEWLKEKLKRRGYIYLNEICESFGAGWNPSNYNVCWIYGRDELVIELEPLDDGSNRFEIIIHN